MALSDITRDAVLQAIYEFDRIGREAFLSKYEYRKARSYFISFNAQQYDSSQLA